MEAIRPFVGCFGKAKRRRPTSGAWVTALIEPDENAPINAHDPNNQIECEECPPGDASDGEDCEATNLDCGDCDGKGLAVWRVSKPNLNLWILDTPVY